MSAVQPAGRLDRAAAEALAAGRHRAPFDVLGPHDSPAGRIVRAFVERRHRRGRDLDRVLIAGSGELARAVVERIENRGSIVRISSASHAAACLFPVATCVAAM